MASDEEPVELRKAVHTFCDATLLSEWMDACRIPVPTSIPRTQADFERRQELTAPRDEAWKLLIADFRRRIASGEIVLEGFQVRPVLVNTRSQFPTAWEPLLQFEWERNAVFIRRAEFVGVTVRRHTAKVSRQSLSSLPSQSCAAETEAVPRRRGRESFAPLIEADLRAHWDETQARTNRASTGEPLWSELARIVYKRLVRQHSRRNGSKVPHEQTIRKHLPKIYRQLLSDKPAQK
ncbi:MAG TPA: hypothetical protein VNZ61_18120 [Roseomonas sp.]|nr:hypothetical protein [Roseomonas sp.]